MNVYRRAAIVVASLERGMADDLLERMPDEQSRAIRDELVLIEELNREEQNAVISEYLNAPSESNSPLDSQALWNSPSAPNVEKSVDAGSEVLNELLEQSDVTIANAITHERSSVVSALLHRLPEKRAAGILRQLHPSLQWRVLSNLNQGRMVAVEIVEVIADRICEQQATRRSDTSESEAHRDALQAIFNELSRDEQREMLRSLAAENPLLAQRLVPAEPASQQDCYC